MRYARDARTKRDIDAFDVHGGAWRRAYVCPVCDAPVHYRSSMGLSPDPGFAHNKYAAKPDCELYHPGLGGYTPSASPPHVTRPSRAEDSAQEIGMCLEDGNQWALYLRLPEIPDLGEVRLHSLRTGSVEVDAGGSKASLSLMELRPGIGAARLVVPPVVVPYKVAPGGNWPLTLSKNLWQGGACGLEPRGTLFRLRRGEWARVREGSAIEFGEDLRVVADARNSPPAECSPEARGVVSNRGISWRMWRVVLPPESSYRVESWAEHLGVVLVEPTWEISLLTVPQGFSSGVPILGTKQPLIAALKNPQCGTKTAVSLRTGSGSKMAADLSADTATAFVCFTVPWPGEHELVVGYDEREKLRFDGADVPNLRNVREALCAVPILRMKIGEQLIGPWGDTWELPAPVRPVEPPEISIEPEFEELRLGLCWSGPDGRGAEEGLTAQAARERLQGFWSGDIEVRISGGALGSIRLRFLAPLRAALQPANTRILRWASLTQQGASKGVSAWLLRRVATLDVKPLKAVRSGSERWAPLVISVVKRSKPSKPTART